MPPVARSFLTLAKCATGRTSTTFGRGQLLSSTFCLGDTSLIALLFQDSIEALTPTIDGQSPRKARRPTTRGFCSLCWICGHRRHHKLHPMTVVTKTVRRSSRHSETKCHLFTGVFLAAINPKIKLASRLRSTLLRKSIRRPVNKGMIQRFQSSRAQDPHRIYLSSRCHCSQPCGIVSACEDYSWREKIAYREEHLTVARPLAPETSFLHLTRPNEKSNSFAVPVLISIPNSPQCRIAVNGSAVAEVIDLHPPSKNGTSRSLRPPCKLHAADSSITSLQFSIMA